MYQGISMEVLGQDWDGGDGGGRQALQSKLCSILQVLGFGLIGRKGVFVIYMSMIFGFWFPQKCLFLILRKVFSCGGPEVHQEREFILII